MRVNDLETPSVLIDLDTVARNIARMQAHCDAHGVKFRPHIKTHKSPEIAQMQLAAGAVGIACQKVSEAEIFAATGIQDIQIPYNIVGPQKTARLADLALYSRITVSADHPAVVAGLAEAAEKVGLRLRVLVDLGTEIQRTGASMNLALELAQQIERSEHLYFAGVLLYPSNPVIRPLLQELLQRLDQLGMGVDVVAGGGFGAVQHLAEMPELTEIRVGTYVFGDWASAQRGWCSLDDCAMRVLTTVVSRSSPDRGILDAGSKTLSSDRWGEPAQYGHIVEYPQARINQLNEEHAYVDFSACETRPDLGEQVHIIPVHTCVVSNLHDQLYGVRGDAVEVVWPVAARGRVW